MDRLNEVYERIDTANNISGVMDILNYKEFYKNRARRYKGERISLLAQVDDTQSILSNLYKDIAKQNILYAEAINRHSRLNDTEIRNKLQEVSKVFTSITYDDNCIIGTTIPVMMTFTDYYKDIITVPMGVYKIDLHLWQGIQFEHVSGGTRSENTSYIHPHISSNGIPCWGTWLKEIAAKHEAFDYLDELQLAYQFLCEANKEGWFINAYAFSADNKDRCKSCWELEENCECDKCEECGEHVDNCECSRCPRSGDLLDEDREYCNGCSSTDEDGHCTR
jgi:hypothetical protein